MKNIIFLIWLIITLISVYLSFIRNNGLSINIIIAIIFSPIYIIYTIAKPINQRCVIIKDV